LTRFGHRHRAEKRSHDRDPIHTKGIHDKGRRRRYQDIITAHARWKSGEKKGGAVRGEKEIYGVSMVGTCPVR